MVPFWSHFPALDRSLERIRERLIRISEPFPDELKSELAPVLNLNGKSLRAGLLLLASMEGATLISDIKRLSQIESVAAAVELLHLATLVHDDIVDQSSLRRGEPTLFSKLGAQKAVLYGDLLLASCFKMITTEVSVENAKAIADVVGIIVGAEIFQWNDRQRLPLSFKRILKKTLGKTALLFSLSLYCGARESGKDPLVSALFRRAGYALGMAFQIQDDLLDWLGDSKKMGKPTFEDLKNGVYTWPVGLAWKEDPVRTQKELDDFRTGRIQAETLKDLWGKRQIWKKTESDVALYVQRAKLDLAKVVGLPGLPIWEVTIEKILSRTY